MCFWSQWRRPWKYRIPFRNVFLLKGVRATFHIILHVDEAVVGRCVMLVWAHCNNSHSAHKKKIPGNLSPFLSFIEKYPPVGKSPSPTSLFYTHLFRNLSPLSCLVISSPSVGWDAVARKHWNRKWNSFTAERERVIHGETYISVIHSRLHLISSHEPRHLQWWIAVVLLSGAPGCLKPSAVWIWKITSVKKTSWNPCSRPWPFSLSSFKPLA